LFLVIFALTVFRYDGECGKKKETATGQIEGQKE